MESIKESIKETLEFFNIEKHLDLVNSQDPRNEQLFEKDKKLYLELTVRDSAMTYFLFKWLYGKYRLEHQQLLFGCQLEAIHFRPPTDPIIKEKLQEIINLL